MRYALRMTLGVFLALGTGLSIGYVSNDLAIASPGMFASGSLAYGDEYYEVYDSLPSGAEIVSAPEWWSSAEFYDEPQSYYDPYYSDSSYVPGDTSVEYIGGPLHGDVDYYDYYDPYESEYIDRVEYVVAAPQTQPWYVTAFPGFGQMAQQIIPGLQVANRIIQNAPQPVAAPPAPRPQYAQPSCWISSEPQRVVSGNSTVLSWNAFHSSSASLTGFGSVPTAGSRVVQNITSPRTFVLSVSGMGGVGSCYTRVETTQSGGAPSCVMSLNPDTIHAGESSSLAWGSLNATSANLSGRGAVEVQGGLTVRPTQSTTYTLTVFGPGGQSTNCVSRLNVN